jgi:hypothetical protein
MAKAVPPRSARIWASRIFGGVPIMVTSPPSSEAKAIGISTRLGDTCAARQLPSAAGSSSASAPTLFITLDAAPVSSA